MFLLKFIGSDFYVVISKRLIRMLIGRIYSVYSVSGRKLFLPIVVLFCLSCSRTVPPAPPPVVETQIIPVFSDPSGATIEIDGVESATTPHSVCLEKNRDHMIVINKKGYKPVAVQVTRKLNSQDLAYSSFLRLTDQSCSPFDEMHANELTGKAYQLNPTIITVELKRDATVPQE